VVVRGYIIGDATYPIRPHLQKNSKTHNAIDVDKHKYVSSMNSRKVLIENAFGSLKTKWHVLRHFNSKVDRVARIVVTYCIFHNYWSKHGWGTQKNCLILYLLDPSLKHVVET
jgi:hypothetical protein